MNPIYAQCYKHIVNIVNESFPIMGITYHAYVVNINKSILEHDCLNDSRRVCKSALEAIDNGYLSEKYANRNVSIYLENLAELSKDMDKKSYILKDKLLENQNDFKEKSNILNQRNIELLHELKDGETPANELLEKIAKLEKDINYIVENDIPEYANNINIYLQTKIEQEICYEVSRYKNEINRLDYGTLPTVMIEQWTDYIPIEVLGDKIPFDTTKDSL